MNSSPLNDILVQLINKVAPPSTTEEDQLKESVLGRLSQMVQEWVRDVGIGQGLDEQLAQETGGQIHTFGSYRLGVSTLGSDIDCLCLVPRFVTRDDFFSQFLERLKNEPDVTELLAVEATRVPLIKFYFCGVQIDLLFARLGLPVLPDPLDLTADSILQNLEDERCVLSINGCRVTDMTLKLVPCVEDFCVCLRAVKIWAKRRGLYNNMMGYLGGVHLSLLVAKVCQLYPNEGPARLLSWFFLFYETWSWPKPICLNEIKTDGPLPRSVWTKAANRSHLMPIITPAYPANNATYNVSKSTFDFMKQEFARGGKIFTELKIFSDTSHVSEEEFVSAWSTLIEPSDFFTTYTKYLRITVTAEDADAIMKWAPFVESRVRLLVMGLGGVNGIQSAIPWHDSFRNEEAKKKEEGEGGEKEEGVKKEEEIKKEEEGEGVKEEKGEDEVKKEDEVKPEVLYFIALVLEKSQPGEKDKRLDLTPIVSNWKAKVSGWMERAETCTVNVDFLDVSKDKTFVFPNGQRPAIRKKRKRKRSSTSVASTEPPPSPSSATSSSSSTPSSAPASAPSTPTPVQAPSTPSTPTPTPNPPATPSTPSTPSSASATVSTAPPSTPTPSAPTPSPSSPPTTDPTTPPPKRRRTEGGDQSTVEEEGEEKEKENEEEKEKEKEEEKEKEGGKAAGPSQNGQSLSDVELLAGGAQENNFGNSRRQAKKIALSLKS